MIQNTSIASPAPALGGGKRAAGDLCLEARLAAGDIASLRASVERWLQRHETGTAHLDGEPCEVRYSGEATFYLRAAGEGLSVFLHATGDDAVRALAWHACDLVDALAGDEVRLTWVRHREGRDSNRLCYG